jgi:hypothetical protein
MQTTFAPADPAETDRAWWMHPAMRRSVQLDPCLVRAR